jgi:hypothetical protein
METGLKESDPFEIPPPLIVVVEDVGWWSGHDGSSHNEPYRTGMPRMHVPSDYSALVTLSECLGAQVLAGLVLCEWDTNDLLKELPSATWMGALWQCPMKGRAELPKAVDILNSHKKHIALALHGIGHEFWDQGRISRTEFHDKDGVMRGRTDILRHMAMFGKLFETAGFDSPFPSIFIPPALKHSFGNGHHGFQQILADAGIGCVLTVFRKARQHSPPIFETITEECGVTLIERGAAPVSWDMVAAKPCFGFDHPVVPLHWANILHPDPDQSQSIAKAWGRYLRQGADKHRFLRLPDVTVALSQIVFHTLARTFPVPGGLRLDISQALRVLSPVLPPSFYMRLPSTAMMPAGQGRLTATDLPGSRMTHVIPEPGTNVMDIRI